MEQIEFINLQTRTLLTFMRFRVVGLLHFELSTHSLTASAYRSLLEAEIDDRTFDNSAAELWRDELKPHIVPRLIPELTSILWAQVVDWLVETSTCQLKGFGDFRVNRAAGTAHVEFAPSPALAENVPPTLLHSTHRNEDLIHTLCHPPVTNLWEDLVRSPDFCSIPGWRLPLIGTTIIDIALNAAWSGVLESRELAREIDNDMLGVLATSASVVAYYAWITAFTFELRTRSEFNMPDIGLFMRRDLHVEFTPVASFLTLLAANLPPLVKGLAA